MNPTPNVITIDDPADPRLDVYRDVRDRDLRGPSGRPGRFIGEQALTVEKMLSIPGLTESVLIAPNWIDRLAPLAPPDVPVYVVTPDTMATIAGFPIHRGVLAVGRRPAPESRTIDAAVPTRSGPLTVLLCEDITNIDNIGLLFRNAAAFAADAVVLSPRCHDPLYRKSIRVSIGHVLTMPWAQSVTWVDDLDRLRREWGITLIAAALTDDARAIGAVDPPDRVGIVVGAEYSGLSADTLARCDVVAKIPMAPGIDSLNVGVASAVFLERFSRGTRR
ncbi:MAG: RNA methyltransferase [Phycisphaerales bacterium]|nr:RNA methyltransferase [Phycisphaerales bacterium]